MKQLLPTEPARSEKRFGGSGTRSRVRCSQLSKRSTLISTLQKTRIGTGASCFFSCARSSRCQPPPRDDVVSFSVHSTNSPPGIRRQHDPRGLRRDYDEEYSDGEIAEAVSSSPSGSDEDECSVLTDITNPTDLRSETQQSLALESTLGEVRIRADPPLRSQSYCNADNLIDGCRRSGFPEPVRGRQRTLPVRKLQSHSVEASVVLAIDMSHILLTFHHLYNTPYCCDDLLFRRRVNLKRYRNKQQQHSTVVVRISSSAVRDARIRLRCSTTAAPTSVTWFVLRAFVCFRCRDSTSRHSAGGNGTSAAGPAATVAAVARAANAAAPRRQRAHTTVVAGAGASEGAQRPQAAGPAAQAHAPEPASHHAWHHS